MDDDQNTSTEPVAEASAPAPEPAPTPVEPESSQPEPSTSSNMPPEAPESPTNASAPIPIKDQDGGVNQPESNAPETPISEPVQHVSAQVASMSAPATLTPQAPQTQSPAQPPQTPIQDQTSFIHALLAKANAKLGLNRQKKLDKVIQLAQKKGMVTNESVQDLLHCSDATATRYLAKLVQQGRLQKMDGSHWVKYRFIR